MLGESRGSAPRATNALRFRPHARALAVVGVPAGTTHRFPRPPGPTHGFGGDGWGRPGLLARREGRRLWQVSLDQRRDDGRRGQGQDVLSIPWRCRVVAAG